MKRIPVIGLFSGAGGLETGATLAGADVRVSVEIDSIACQTLMLNASYHGSKVIQEDVALLNGKDLRSAAGLSRTDPCLVIGGPPCQPFSKAAYWTDPGEDFRFRRARARGEKAVAPLPITVPKPDQRRSLLDEFKRIVIEAKSNGFLFENVPSITHPRNRTTFAQFVRSFEEAGYATTLIKANAAEYGVPQRRNRVFLLGLRTEKPKEAILKILEVNNEIRCLNVTATAGEAIAQFRGRKFFEPEEVVRGRWAEQLREIPPGTNYKALTAWAGHPFEAETRFSPQRHYA